jgi:phage protein D
VPAVDPQLFDGNSALAVNQPLLEISFGGTDAAIGGLASTVGGALGVDLDGSTDIWSQHVASVTVEAGLAPSVDTAAVRSFVGQQAPSAAVDDSGSISLGYADSSTELVFTGEVESVGYTVQGATRITATNGGASLSRLRINQSYEQQKAGDIVRDLAGRAGVDTDTVEDGVEFPFYVADDRQSAYRHVAALARKSGYVAWLTPEGKLNFAPFSAGQAVQTFTYGEDILSLAVADAVSVIGTVTTVGEGAAGSQGQEAWSWLVKDPTSVKGSAGDAGAERQVQDASLRSGDAAQSAAEGIANAVGLTKLTGKLLVPGAPAVAVGLAVEVAGAPQDALNGLYLVTGVRHCFSKTNGFTTLIGIGKTGEGGLGGLL